MFDNLKKSITYSLSPNVPEIIPVVAFILFQFPIPLSNILMLAVCVGTDMLPAISLAYETSELDIMERQPRNQKRDHLVSMKLLGFCYGQTGAIQACAGMFTYFFVMNDYGFKPLTLFFLNNQEGYFPNSNDIYDPNLPNFGNTNYGNPDSKGFITWGMTYESSMDARLFYTTLNRNDWSKCRWDPQDESIPRFWRYSRQTETQICYTSESLLYAQSSYFIAIIITQAANVIACKTRAASLS
jgi:sodium/potassium-transporting ATPase subunit alpha